MINWVCFCNTCYKYCKSAIAKKWLNNNKKKNIYSNLWTDKNSSEKLKGSSWPSLCDLRVYGFKSSRKNRYQEFMKHNLFLKITFTCLFFMSANTNCDLEQLLNLITGRKLIVTVGCLIVHNWSKIVNFTPKQTFCFYHWHLRNVKWTFLPMKCLLTHDFLLFKVLLVLYCCAASRHLSWCKATLLVSCDQLNSLD